MFSRRELVGCSAAVGGLLLGARFANASMRSQRATADVTAWLRIAPDNRVILIASQSEMGQGATTTLAATLADELYLRWEQVHVEFASFDPAYRDPLFEWMFTGNSQSISSFYDIMRKMGAAARTMLIEAAAKHWRVTTDRLHTANGVIHLDGSRRKITFGQVAVSASKMPVPKDAQLRSDPQYRGRPLARWDIPAKVDGSAIYGIDVRLPGLCAAAVRRAPRFGATLARYDEQAIKAKPGVLGVVEVPDGLAVVAATYWQAHTALDAAELVWSDSGSTMSSGDGLPPVYREKLSAGPFFTYKSSGDVDAALASDAAKYEAFYEIPFEAHATMEPMNCTAHVTSDKCEIWVPTQAVEMTQNVASQVTGLPLDRIVVHRTLIGGGFGRRLLADFVKQCLVVAMAVKRPVKLIWSREEDMTHDFYRPAMLHRISASLDKSGQVAALGHRVISPSYMLYIIPRGFLGNIKDWTSPVAPPEKIDTMAIEGLVDILYDIPNQKVEQHRLDCDVPTSAWRTTGHGANNFVLESFIDEIALSQKVDPLAFRRGMLKANPRALKVLDVLEEKSNWAELLESGHGRGLALGSAFGGVFGASARLSIADSKIILRKIVCVVDCGTTLDPGIAESNILGGIVWGLSALRTEVTLKNGQVEQLNFDSFDPFHLWETPPAEVHFVESGEKLGGTGELGPVAIPAAVCNAIFAATGKRVRSLPLSREGFAFA